MFYNNNPFIKIMISTSCHQTNIGSAGHNVSAYYLNHRFIMFKLLALKNNLNIFFKTNNKI